MDKLFAMNDSLSSVSETDIESALGELCRDKQVYLSPMATNDLKTAAVLLLNRLTADVRFNANVTICGEDIHLSDQLGDILVELIEKWFPDSYLSVTEEILYKKKEWKDIYIREWKAIEEKCRVILVKNYTGEHPTSLYEVLSDIEEEGWSPSVILCSDLESLDKLKMIERQDYRLFHYLCGYKLIIPAIQERDISELTYRTLEHDGCILTDAFKQKLNLYIRAVYPEAQLTKKAFVDDLIQRIYQVHYQKFTAGKSLDEDDVPYSAKAEAIATEKREQESVKAEVITAEKKRQEPVKAEVITAEKKRQEPVNVEVIAEEDAPELVEVTLADIEKDAPPQYEICPQNDNINILLLALSTFPFNKEEEYHFVSPTSFLYGESSYVGRYQLDPVPKLLSKELNDKGERLDYIIAFCTTKKDKKGNLLTPEVKKVHQVEVPLAYKGRRGIITTTELDYFKEQIKMYMPADIEERVIPVILDENNPSVGIEEAINTIRSKSKNYTDDKASNIHLHMDTHGGFRDVQLILQAVISLLGRDEITVENFFSVKYGKGHNTIAIDKSTEMFDFASGINEFINFGRLTSLERYFSKYPSENNQDTKELLKILKKISDSISICDTTEFEDGLNKLTKYYDDNPELTGHGYLSVFSNTIKEDFGILLKKDRTTVDEIKWCLKKSFYQQALTLVESRMPEEFVKNGLRYYCDESNESIVKEVLTEYRQNVNNNNRWQVEDVDHFFIKYYNVMRKNGYFIRDIIAENHDDRYRLTDKSLYSGQDVEDFKKLYGLSKNDKTSYRGLCDLRNPINHAKDIPITADELHKYIEAFISEYERILRRPHKDNNVIRFRYSENGFEAIHAIDEEHQSDLSVPAAELAWKDEYIDSSIHCSELEMRLMKMTKYTFRQSQYPGNRTDFTSLRNDMKSVCCGEIPKKNDLGMSPLQLLHDKSKGMFTRDGNIIIWNPDK